MKVTLLQAPLQWENPEANRIYFSQQIQRLPLDTNLVLLPEMFTTGFTMTPEKVAETMSGPTVHWMLHMARQFDLALVGSVAITENGHYYNRLLFVEPSGRISQYDKRHLFTLAGEEKVYTPGNGKLILQYRGWKICALVCYDLRFPVFSRNAEHYDLLLYVANWPQARTYAWDALLKARAIENVCYVAAVNRVGADANGHVYEGHSQILDALGNALFELAEGEAQISAEISLETLQEVRGKFAFLNDQDAFTVTD